MHVSSSATGVLPYPTYQCIIYDCWLQHHSRADGWCILRCYALTAVLYWATVLARLTDVVLRFTSTFWNIAYDFLASPVPSFAPPSRLAGWILFLLGCVLFPRMMLLHLVCSPWSQWKWESVHFSRRNYQEQISYRLACDFAINRNKLISKSWLMCTYISDGSRRSGI